MSETVASESPLQASQRGGGFITGAAIMQALVVPYLLLAGLMAAEMSALLSTALLAHGVVVAVAAGFLFRRRLWAWRLSAALATLAFLVGAGATLMPPAWVGGIHAAGAAAILGLLLAGRPAVVGARPPGATEGLSRTGG
ncbi:hypothetical protein HUA74_40905 [Myxococcus sp. CA051A]|uniref:hypothetical protein n=1 Tax=unclassified Myxococcus TaxID=2648731 RepID=UPI00157A762C|nr:MULTISPECIES: hypothetical protein [unclassified Myxococcus]NTX40416.1 hypothetical protein [Myxococcus sp. CA033]NTX51517.1 hypothetical protein [Myxococcus sp. CA039A]NTX67030.1 hypothetical protein [Myxococcus sp. CA051A]